MKKHTAMFFTFTALLTLNAFAPQVLWQEKKFDRQPASMEEDRLEELALKKSSELELLELVEVQLKEDRSVVEVKVEELAQCQQDNKSAQLEEQIKKLVEDKDSILKELQELKDLRKAKKEASEKGVKKPKVAKEDKEKVEVIDIMSQLTNLMISQQAQQEAMMYQMFSMMPMQQMQQQPRRFSLNDYMPYTIDHSEYEMYSNGSFHAMGRRIGISYPSYAPQNYFSPYAMEHSAYDLGNRMPSNEAQVMPQRYNNPSAYVAPQQPQQIPHSGFNFSNGSNIERVNF